MMGQGGHITHEDGRQPDIVQEGGPAAPRRARL